MGGSGCTLPDLDLITDPYEEETPGWVGLSSRWGSAQAFGLAMGGVELEGFPPAFSPEEFSQRPAPPWLVPLYIPSGLTAWYGPTNSGKTFAALDAGLGLATGGHWAGQPLPQRNVMYFLAEGQGEASKRVEAWAAFHGSSLVSLEGRFWIVPQRLPLGGVVPDGINMAVVAKQLNIGLIILDTWARTLEGDENDNHEVSTTINLLTDIRANSPGSDLSVWVVHHTGYASDTRMRGASAFAAALDCEVRIEGHLNDPSAPHIQVVCTKQRDAAYFPPFILDARDSGESIAFDPTPRQPINSVEVHAGGPDPGRKAVVVGLLHLGPRSAADLREMSDISATGMKRVLEALVEVDGLVEEVPGRPMKYRLRQDRV